MAAFKKHVKKYKLRGLQVKMGFEKSHLNRFAHFRWSTRSGRAGDQGDSAVACRRNFRVDPVNVANVNGENTQILKFITDFFSSTKAPPPHPLALMVKVSLVV